MFRCCKKGDYIMVDFTYNNTTYRVKRYYETIHGKRHPAHLYITILLNESETQPYKRTTLYELLDKYHISGKTYAELRRNKQ